VHHVHSLRSLPALLGLALISSALACGGGNRQPAGMPSTAQHGSAATPADQIEQGKTAYTQYCSGCHGASGQGTQKAPAVVGKDALPLDPRPEQKLRKNQFHTMQDVFDFTKANMPPTGPKLSDEQYWNILAFALKANGVDLAGKKLDATTAPSVVLHP
jgi:S-disulfanyl-L-cysteine oxidoreductase SoxD